MLLLLLVSATTLASQLKESRTAQDGIQAQTMSMLQKFLENRTRGVGGLADARVGTSKLRLPASILELG